jgi:hypothetical protein
MLQTAGESTTQRPLPRDLADEAYALVPRRGDFTSRLELQEATITYLSVWLGDGQPVTFYAPLSSGCPRRFNGTLGECTGLPWIVDCFYIWGLDRDYRKNRVIRRALDDINSRTQWLDDHPDIEDHPDDVQAPDPTSGPPA